MSKKLRSRPTVSPFFLCQHNFSACLNHDLPYLKYFDMHRDSRVREGDDAGRVSPFATSIGMIAALTKDKNAVVALNNVNGGGGTYR